MRVKEIPRWPRYEDGEPVLFGDELSKFARTVHKTVRNVTFQDNGYVVIDNGGGSANVSVILKSGERVRRPQVLAADGEPLEVGQTVWTIEGGISFEVHSIDGDEVWGCLDGDDGDDSVDPKDLTHKRPVLDADGVPIHDGDTVWDVEDGKELEVVRAVCTDGLVLLKLWTECGGYTYTATEPEHLTHAKPEPPDSYEKLWQDMRSTRKGYAVGLGFDEFVRRCKKLAGVSE